MNDDRDGDSSQVPQPVGRGTEPAEIEFSRERADVRRHKRTGRALYALIAIAGSSFALLVALSFFGTAEQSKTAIEVLKYVASGLAGYGLGYAVLSALRRLARPRASMQRI